METEQQKVIQSSIDENRQVVFMKENEKTTVRIRFNNQDTDGTKKWRLLIGGNEFHVQEAIFHCKTRTISEELPEVGLKHHIYAEAEKVVIENKIAYVR